MPAANGPMRVIELCAAGEQVREIRVPKFPGKGALSGMEVSRMPIFPRRWKSLPSSGDGAAQIVKALIAGQAQFGIARQKRFPCTDTGSAS